MKHIKTIFLPVIRKSHQLLPLLNSPEAARNLRDDLDILHYFTYVDIECLVTLIITASMLLRMKFSWSTHTFSNELEPRSVRHPVPEITLTRKSLSTYKTFVMPLTNLEFKLAKLKLIWGPYHHLTEGGLNVYRMILPLMSTQF